MTTRIRAALLALAMSAACLNAAAGTPSHHLTAHQVHRIVRTTGYRGLRSHHFDIATTFGAGGAKTVVVRLDRARVGVALHLLRTDIGLAIKLAAASPRFTSKIKLGSGRPQRITFAVAPAGVLAPHEPYLRYFIFTRHDQRLATLTEPQRVPAVQALTVVDPGHRINVTLLQDGANDATWGPGVPAAQLFAMVESLNTASYVSLTPKTSDRLSGHHTNSTQLVAFGREI